jgi:hypothetical protein
MYKTVTAAGATEEEARAKADAYLEHRGYRGTVVAVRRNRSKTGMLGYVAWDLRYRLEGPKR